MAIEYLTPSSLGEVRDFVKNKDNDVSQLWVFHKGVYLGSLLPKDTELRIVYDDEQLIMTIYINESDEPNTIANISDLTEKQIYIANTELCEYKFAYL